MINLTDDVVARFWAKVDRRSDGECWEWQAGKMQGYGYMSVANRQRAATHISLTIDGRPRPDGLLALHSCDNPGCVNPAHLRWGTEAENVQDMRDRDRFRHGEGSKDSAPGKLRADDVRDIRSSPRGYKWLARLYGVERTTIRAIKRGKLWKHVA